MRAKTLQIVWHGKPATPVLSVDFHPDGYLATAGGDNEIKARKSNRAPRSRPEAACDGAHARAAADMDAGARRGGLAVRAVRVERHGARQGGELRALCARR
jgi:hypothetical protein